MMNTTYNNSFPFKATNTCVLNHEVLFVHLDIFFFCGEGRGSVQVGKELIDGISGKLDLCVSFISQALNKQCVCVCVCV